MKCYENSLRETNCLQLVAPMLIQRIDASLASICTVQLRQVLCSELSLKSQREKGAHVREESAGQRAVLVFFALEVGHAIKALSV